MSRTDAHRPYTVWLADESRWREETHRHDTGPCTLPDDPADIGNWRGCTWTLRPGSPTGCGCRMCTGHYPRHWANKGRRVQERALQRAAARGADDTELETLESRTLARGRRW